VHISITSITPIAGARSRNEPFETVPKATTGIEPVDRSNEIVEPSSEEAEEGKGPTDGEGDLE